MKQGEQGGAGPARAVCQGRSGNPAGRPRGCRDHVNRAARLLLASEGEALTRKAVELALAGEPDGDAALPRTHAAVPRTLAEQLLHRLVTFPQSTTHYTDLS